MMNGFNSCNHVSGLYRSTDDIANFKFIVKCKEVNKIIPLPNFEAFALQDRNADKDFNEHYEERTLSWQEKILSSHEINSYKDVGNCKSDVEKKYHNSIEENQLKPSIHSPKIFTYTDEDNYNLDKHLTTEFKKLGGLEKKLEKLYMDIGTLDNSSLFKENNEISNKANKSSDHTVRMCLMIDMNNSESDPAFLLKREHVLFELLWNKKEGTLTVSPDFNDLFINPYVLETNYYSKQIFHYSIEQVVQEFLDDAKLAELQLLEKYDESHHAMHNTKMFKNFELPPKNILKCLYIVKIISANIPDFLEGLYIEYTVELPFGYLTADRLKGVTQIAKPKRNDDTAYFGHVFELCFQYQMGISVDESDLPQEPEIYFEIISCDSWGRHRTEGYCYSKLPVTKPGRHIASLKCARPRGSNERLWEMKRFFVGGKHVVDDLTWLSVPAVIDSKKLNKVGVKTVSSGTLDVCINVILQSRNFAKHDDGKNNPETHRDETVAEKLTADSLFKSVNMVLQAYKHAKEKLTSSQEHA